MTLTDTDNKPKTAAKHTLFDAVSSMGEMFFAAFLSILTLIAHSILWLIAAFLRGYDRIKVPLKRTLRNIGGFFAGPFIRYGKAMKMGSAEIARSRREKGVLGGVLAWFRVTGRLIFGKRGWAVTIVNWALPVVSCVFLFNIVTYANNQQYALKLIVNGDFLGFIENETVFADAEKMVQKRINYTGSSTEIITFEPSYEVDLIGTGSSLNQYQLTDKLLEMLDKDIQHGYGLYVGDAYYGTLLEHDRVDAALDGLLAKYRTGEEKETVEFDRDISYIYGLYLTDSFVSEDEIIRQLTSKRQEASYYTVVDDDSPSLVCEKLGMTYEELERLNPGFGEDTELHTGDRIQTTVEVPYLTIIVTREEHYNEPIPYSTEFVDDELLYAGNRRPQTEGVDGERYVVANVSYINGTEISRRVLSRATVRQPVTEIIAIGTKPRPADAAPGTDFEYGKMLWPVGGYDGGGISEMVWWHGGYEGHDGVDITTAIGTPIYAADNGVVVATTWGGYADGRGNHIIIQHDNGFRTYYYHCSDLYTYVGQQVTAGDLIALVGMTGQTTGPHLHFGLKLGDEWLNPLDYLPWHYRESWCIEY